MRSLFLLFCGAILPLSFAPFNNWVLAIVAVLGLMFALEHASKKQAAWRGLVFGLGFFGVGASWIYVSIHTFGGTNQFLSGVITFLFVIILAGFISLQAYLLKLFYPGKSGKSGKLKCGTQQVLFALVGMPTMWVVSEWFRSWFLTGFPWLYLGYSETSGPLRAWAPVIGVYGISFLLVFTSGALFIGLKMAGSAIRQRSPLSGKDWLLLLGLGLLVAGIWGAPRWLQHKSFTTTADNNKITVALLQGNIAPNDKFLLHDPINTIDSLYGAMTRENLDANVIVWPENALPVPQQEARPYLKLLATLAAENKVAILLGNPEIADQYHYYNSLVALAPKPDAPMSVYHKQRLVPFGDYLPFENWLRGLINFFDLPMSSFISGHTASVIDIGYSKIMPLICYEIAFPSAILQKFKTNNNNHEIAGDAHVAPADVLLTISEDGWFGNSFGPYQHLQIAQMRALETGRYVLRATTSGISAIIKPDGSIQASAPQFTPYVLRDYYYNMQGSTPIMRFGVLPLILLNIVVFLVGAVVLRFRRVY
jgi:apolipoprotein N-acyltransferase